MLIVNYSSDSIYDTLDDTNRLLANLLSFFVYFFDFIVAAIQSLFSSSEEETEE